MNQASSNARHAVVDALIQQVRLNGATWLGVMSDKQGVAKTLAQVEVQLRLLADDDNGDAFRTALNKPDVDDAVKTVTLTAEDLTELIALEQNTLGNAKESLKKVRENRELLLANCAEPDNEAWLAGVEKDLEESVRWSAAEIRKLTRWLAHAPVELRRVRRQSSPSARTTRR